MWQLKGYSQKAKRLCLLLSINGFASSAIASGEISSLAHELWDDAVEHASLVAKAFLSSTECPEVF